jgi:HSP20 family protein
MNLIKFDPWVAGSRPWLSVNRPLIRTNHHMPTVFDDFFNMNIGDFIGSDAVSSLPSVNITENEQGYLLSLAAPGLTKEDFRISLDKDRLTISSEKTSEHESTEQKFTRREFNYSAFSRSFVLPKSVDKDSIKAKYENGVLMLSVPKKAEVVKEERSRVIEIL